MNSKVITTNQTKNTMSLLTELHEQKRAASERLRSEMRHRCREILRALLPAGSR